MGVDVDLLFHPVGQGLFASGHLKRTQNSSGAEFTWIYDCGSSSAGQPEVSAVNRLAAHLGGVKPRIDLLVISHFDHDHISGIPHLLSTFDVKRIVIPLVPMWIRLLVVSKHGLSITTGEQSLILDPVGTLSGLPEGDAPDEIVVVLPTEGPERSSPWAPEGSPDDQSLDVRVERDDSEPALESSSSYGPVATGSKTQVSHLRKSGRITVGNLWEFVPYNDLRSISQAPPMLVHQASLLSKKLLSAPSQRDRTHILANIKHLYHMNFLTSETRNRLSLFLYAGASQTLHRTHQIFNGYWHAYPGLPSTPDRRGVLYTGDGTLRAKKSWSQLLQFMGSQRLTKLIAMQVMHHGSKLNWHKGLASNIQPEISVFPADRHHKNRHPDDVVWDDFASCSDPVLVDTRSFCHLTHRFS